MWSTAGTGAHHDRFTETAPAATGASSQESVVQVLTTRSDLTPVIDAAEPTAALLSWSRSGSS